MIPIVVKDSDGNIVDITGYTFTLTVDPSPAPADNSNNLFSIAGTITDALAGEVEFQPSTAQTDVSPGVYFYDIQMVTDTPSVRTILSGQFEIKPDITKA